MIKRIVKMRFRPEAVDTFIREVFDGSKDRIRSFPGCLHMELLRATDEPDTLFTLSYWESPEHLETYRRSDLFQDTWARTKALFAHRAEAWSTEVIDAP